jgi:orotate phosphoribosyltransferase
MKKMGVNLHYLATWENVLQGAEEGRYFNQAAIDGVRTFLDDPVGWSKAHGGRGE